MNAHAVVTGGASGIGRGIASLLANRGARVSVVSRSAASSQAENGVFCVNADVSRERDVVRALNACRAVHGEIGILVNSAGVAESAPLMRTSAAMWDRIIATNLTGTFLCTRFCLEDMLAAKWGRILNVASIAGLHGAAYIAAYCASKHGVVGFTRSIAAELEGTGVTANALCPGYTQTDMVGTAIANIVRLTGLSHDDARQRLAEASPGGRIATVQEVAQAALDLIDGTRNGATAIVPDAAEAQA